MKRSRAIACPCIPSTIWPASRRQGRSVPEHPRLGLDGVRAVPGAGPDHRVLRRLTRHSGSSCRSITGGRSPCIRSSSGPRPSGMTVIIIAGGIDLSVGSTVALVTVCMALFMKKVDPTPARVPAGLARCHAAGDPPRGRIGGVVRGGQWGARSPVCGSSRSSSRWGLIRSIVGSPPGSRRVRRSTSPADEAVVVRPDRRDRPGAALAAGGPRSLDPAGPERRAGDDPALQPAGPLRLRDRFERVDRSALRDQRRPA